MQIKKVRFAIEKNKTYTFTRPLADNIQDIYYQEHEYRRFREEKCLDDLREGKRRQAGIQKNPRRQRDSLTMMMNPKSYSSQLGIAQAA